MADVTDTASGPATGAYRVLARKYRPATFDDLIGQDAMVRTLSNAFETGRIPQAWMLTGVRGVGKTTTARILARGLNYDVPGGDGRPSINMPVPGVHCQAIIEGRHVDVLEMDAASHTGINDIREIIDAVRYKPMSARYKVYVIDEVHMLSTAAFNGLLKTLEEPPEHAKFVFATTEIRKVPVTVLSRCQRFDLRRVESRLLTAHLTKIAGLENVTLEPEAAALLARAAEGSVRDSLSLLDQAIAHGGGHVTAEVVRQMLGLADRLRVYDLFEAVMRGDAKAALDQFDAQYRDGADPATVVSELAEAVHAVTRAKVAPDAARDAGGPEQEIARVADLAGRLTLKVLARAWQMLLKGMTEVREAPRPVAAAEMLIVRLCHAADLPTPDELIRAIEDGGGSSAGGPSMMAPRGGGGGPAAAFASPVTATSPSPAGSPVRAAALRPVTAIAPRPAAADTRPRVDLNKIEDLVALAQMRRDVPLKIALERFVHPVAFERGRIVVRLADGAPPTIVTDAQKRLLEWTGERWTVEVVREGGGPTLAEQAEARQKSLVDDIRAHPTVAAVLSRFPGAEIVDVRVNKPEPAAEVSDDLPPDHDVTDEDF